MSTHKNIDRICCVVIALALVLTVAFMNGERLGAEAVAYGGGYEKRLFDTSRVHRYGRLGEFFGHLHR